MVELPRAIGEKAFPGGDFVVRNESGRNPQATPVPVIGIWLS